MGRKLVYKTGVFQSFVCLIIMPCIARVSSDWGKIELFSPRFNCEDDDKNFIFTPREGKELDFFHEDFCLLESLIKEERSIRLNTREGIFRITIEEYIHVTLEGKGFKDSLLYISPGYKVQFINDVKRLSRTIRLLHEWMWLREPVHLFQAVEFLDEKPEGAAETLARVIEYEGPVHVPAVERKEFKVLKEVLEIICV